MNSFIIIAIIITLSAVFSYNNHRYIRLPASIGPEKLVLTWYMNYIPLVLLARIISVGVPVAGLRLMGEFSPNAVRIMIWCGLRGGISIALACCPCREGWSAILY